MNNRSLAWILLGLVIIMLGAFWLRQTTPTVLPVLPMTSTGVTATGTMLPPVAVELQSKPTDVGLVGTIIFSSGSRMIPFLLQGGNRKELTFDVLSACATEISSTPCLLMSTSPDILYENKQVTVDGESAGDKILVRKIQTVQQGEIPAVPPKGTVYIAWPEAKQLIEACSVTRVLQTHHLDVQLTLKDGRRVTAVEPRIDEVFPVIFDGEAPCQGMTSATE